MNRESTYVGIWVSAQIVIGVIAWFFLGGASLVQFAEALLVALVPTTAIFHVRERQLRVCGAKTEPLTRKMAATISLVMLVIYSTLVLFSLTKPVGSYMFNLSMYVTALGFSVGLEVWLAWTRVKKRDSGS